MVSKKLYGSKLLIHLFGKSRPFEIAKQLKDLDLDNKTFGELPTVKDAITFLIANCFAIIESTKNSVKYLEDSKDFINDFIDLFSSHESVLNIKEVFIGEHFQRIYFYKGETKEYYKGSIKDYAKRNSPENVLFLNKSVLLSNSIICAYWLEVIGDNDYQERCDFEDTKELKDIWNLYPRGRVETLLKIQNFIIENNLQ